MSKAVSEVKENAGVEAQRESGLWEWTKTIIYAIILALFIRTFFLQTFRIPTGSMEPTLQGEMNHGHGDKIIVLKFIYGIPIPFTEARLVPLTEPHRGDVVVFKTKGIESLDQRKDFIKRIIAVAGDRVQIVPDDPATGSLTDGGGHIFINGEPLEEPRISNRIYYPVGPFGEGEVTIPPDSYFMLGDNSENSRDSRYWGFVPKENILGKAVAIYWPPKRIGVLH